MNFLNSAILIGLAAALLPLLIHLLNRQKVRRIEFSSLMFLRNLQKTRMRRLKLRQLLLLIVRTLIITLLVLAFARPTMTNEAFSSIGSRTRTTMALLIDASASMHARTSSGTASERAIRAAGQLTELIQDGDQAVRGLVSDETELSPLTADLSGMTERLRDHMPGAGSTDILTAVEQVEEVFGESRNLNREVFIFSDLARNGYISRAALETPTRDQNTQFYIVRTTDDGITNAAITDVRLSGQLIEPGVPFSLTVTTANRSAEQFDHLLIGVFLDGRRVAQGEVTLQPEEASPLEFRLQVDSAGLHRGYVELADDDNLIDNRVYFTIRIPAQIDVLLVSDFPSERAFVRRALNPGGGGRLGVTELNTPDLIRTNLASYDALVLTAVRRPEPAVLENLHRYLRAGGGVLIIPAPDLDTSSYNTNILSQYFQTDFTRLPEELPEKTDYFTLDRRAWRHPILSVYRDVSADQIPEVRFYSRYELASTKDLSPVLSFTDGRPALVEATIERGKILLWCAPLGPDYSDLSYHSLIVPLTGRAVEYLAADVGEQAVPYIVGQSVSRPQALAWRGPLILEFPSGRREQLSAEVAANTEVYTTGILTEPGCYTLHDRNDAVDIFAVNVDPAETEINSIEQEEIQQRMPGRQITILDDDDDLIGAVMSARYGREIWKFLFWGVVLLLVFEFLLARTRKSELPPDLQN